jgi:hypothetical protein
MSGLILQPRAAGARWLRSMLLCGFMLALLGAAALPAHAQEHSQLPPVNNFATAQFKLLLTLDLGTVQAVAYGGGEVVLPDRTRLWLGTDFSEDLTEIVQIGSTVYQRTGSGPWEQTNSGGLGNMQTQPISAQFNFLQTHANAILKMGDEMVGDVPTVRYQVWLSGDQALALNPDMGGMLPDETREELEKLAFKYDLWVSPQDGFLHQQLVTIMMPATKSGKTNLPASQISILETFFDINDPLISVNPPI